MGSLRSLMKREMAERTAPSDAELIAAVESGTLKKVQDLLVRGANPNAIHKTSRDSALSIAAWTGKIGKVRLLIKNGADVNHRDIGRNTPLHEAADAGPRESVAIAKDLLDHGADINALEDANYTPLMFALVEKRYDMAKLLIDRGADATLRNAFGDTALDLVGTGRGYKAVKRLLEQVS